MTSPKKPIVVLPPNPNTTRPPPPRKPPSKSMGAVPDDEPGDEPRPADGCMVNALDKWDAEIASPTASTIHLIQLGANETLLVPFTSQIGEVDVHWFNAEREFRSARCRGDGCLLCRVGNRPTLMDLLPVYDPIERGIGVLAISPSRRPESLRPRIQELFEELNELGDQRQLLIISKPAKGVHHVRWEPLAAGADDGARVIRPFLAALAAGKIDLRQVYSNPTNDELASYQEIADAMRARGIAP